MTTPNFFIIGAPKCGTTALSEYLRMHPSIYMSTPKEPHFFATDLPKYRTCTDWASYLDLFSSANDGDKAVGEASVFYLYSREALSAIRRAVPNAKLIVMLRDPVQLAFSMHSQALLSRDESVVSFEKAWRLCSRRRAGKDLPPGCRDGKILQYDRVALIGEQLERALMEFPRENVRWWFLEDLQTDARLVYEGVLAHLGVASDGRTEFAVVNERRRSKSQVLARFTQETPDFLVRAAMAAKRSIGIKRWGVLGLIRRFNRTKARPASLSPTLEREMRQLFADDVRLLQTLTGRDLTGWLPSAPADATA